MSFRDMNTDEMLSAADTLLVPEVRANLSRDDLMKSLLTRLAAVVSILRTHNLDPGAVAVQVKSLTDILTVLDALFDRKMRGAYYLLQAAANLSDDPADVATFEAAQEKIFPDGLKIITATYQAEGGRAQRIAALIQDPLLQSTLKRLRIDDTSAFDALQQATDAASELASQDAERTRLIHMSDPSATTPQDLLRTRNQWISVMNLIQDSLPLSGLSAEEQTATLSTVQKLSAAAATRARATRDQAPPPKPSAKDTP